MKKFNSLLLLSLSIFLLAGCDPDDPTPVNEEEIITTLIYTLTPKGGGNEITFKFNDPDGDGGKIPTITGAVLEKDKLYVGKITLLNEIKNPVTNITDEVNSEALDHQFFYAWTADMQNSLALAYTDEDSGKNPIGISTELTTKAIPAKGIFRITLRHMPNKGADGVKTGIITNAGGEADIEVEFPIEVK
jgi:hypothetical protein